MSQELRQLLIAQAKKRETLSYQAVARELRLLPPHTIHQVTQALELTMWEDLAEDRPFLAALVVSKRGNGLPAPGFFDCAQRTGRFQNDGSAAAASEFHGKELAAALAYWAG
ncbi:hypothetical protein ACTL6U_06440 [Rhodovibrionaceae bacterium A322]